MALDTKHRPKSLKRVVGNSDMISALESVLNKKNPPHTYLFTGESGCGKTTLGRIVSKAFGCSSEDFIEINTADNRGIDTIRDIKKQSRFLPMNGKVRFWLIDECHQLSKDAQNAILKELEEPPKHVYYVLCTTDPQKLLPTIRGRCSIFHVNPLKEAEMTKLLKRIAKKEGDKLSERVLEQIILDSQGKPRDAIKILEQVLSVPEASRLKVAEQKAAELNVSIDLCKALLNPKASWRDVAKILKGLKDVDPEGIRRHVLGYAQSVVLNGKMNKRAALILEEFLEPTYNSGFPQLTYACLSVFTD